ncbi:MAG TPA: response regulator transcription factor [Candidatus Binatus sp.]|jgi:FixJ family two-component response regulator|nr:response regulator transcription factor [Candidatus Binatus sp.]
MNAVETTVFVIDDDKAVRTAIRNLLESVGIRVETFNSPQDFLKADRKNVPGCLVLDVRLQGISGLDFQKQLAAANIEIPIIFITGHGDIPMTVQAMKAGAVDFLTKPFRDQDFLDAIQKAVERDRDGRAQEAEVTESRRRFNSLTPREREVMALVVAGKLNKQIAAELGTSETTAKVHRGQVMKKMQVQSLPDLVRIAERLGLPSQTC